MKALQIVDTIQLYFKPDTLSQVWEKPLSRVEDLVAREQELIIEKQL